MIAFSSSVLFGVGWCHGVDVTRSNNDYDAHDLNVVQLYLILQLFANMMTVARIFRKKKNKYLRPFHLVLV